MKTPPAEFLKKASEIRHPDEALRDAATLLQLVAQGEEDLAEGRAFPQEQALERVHSRVLRG